jgi:hypothetical protein
MSLEWRMAGGRRQSGAATFQLGGHMHVDQSIVAQFESGVRAGSSNRLSRSATVAVVPSRMNCTPQLMSRSMQMRASKRHLNPLCVRVSSSERTICVTNHRAA